MDINKLLHLSELYTGKTPIKYQILPKSGSQRTYVRIFVDNRTIMGAYNSNVDENRAFIKLANVFKNNKLPVPDILFVDSSEQYYLITDHGNTSLFDYLNNRPQIDLSPDTYKLLEKALSYLVEFQLCGHLKNFYENCNTPKAFNQRSILWDFNYFKYNFLKLTNIEFNESLLEDDFDKFSKMVSNIPLQGFMYRDFQSRNILIDQGNLIFIDFQGGRKGPMQYDVISFLWQARANLSEKDRNNLLDYYLNILETKLPNKRAEFMADFNLVMILRLTQVLGTYGFRGLYERKSHFLASIYSGINQLMTYWQKSGFKNSFPELNRCIIQLDKFAETFAPKEAEYLVIQVCSFSFLNGSYPVDLSGHGGGYVFDCRALPNPGRLEEFKHLTGKDSPVINYLKGNKEVTDFINLCSKIILKHARVYKDRGFRVLNVSFGCTGGQHRSVYCAETISRLLTKKGYNVVLKHRELK